MALKQIFFIFLFFIAVILGLFFNVTIASKAQANMTANTEEWNNTDAYINVHKVYFAFFPSIATIIIILAIIGSIVIFKKSIRK